MKPQNFVKEFNRMCGQYKHQGMDDDCDKDCPMYNKDCWQGKIMDTSHPKKFAEAYDIVAEWSDANPGKTRQSELLKIIPNAVMYDGDGVVYICPRDIIGEYPLHWEYEKCEDCMRDYWLAPIGEDEVGTCKRYE